MENKKVCSTCGDPCCKWVPGATSPHDFGDPMFIRKNIVKALKSSKYCIDFFEISEEPYTVVYIRPRTKQEFKEDPDRIVSKGHIGECIFFDNNSGCELEHTKRPIWCRTLVPVAEKDCIQALSCEDIIAMWKTFSPLVHEIRRSLSV
jgi:hypothetical protein